MSGTALDSVRETNDIASYDPSVSGWRISFPSPVKLPSDTIHVAQICSDPQQCKDPPKSDHVGILNCTQVVAALQYEQWQPVFSTCPFDGDVLPTNPAVAFSLPNDIILLNSPDLISASRSLQHNMSTVLVRLVSVSRVDLNKFFTSINSRTVDFISPSPTFSHLQSQHKCVNDGYFFVPNHAVLVYTESEECEWTCGPGFLKRPWMRKAKPIENFAQCVSIPNGFFSLSLNFKIKTTLRDETLIEDVLKKLNTMLEDLYPGTLFFSKLVRDDKTFAITKTLKETAQQSESMENVDIVDLTSSFSRRRLLQLSTNSSDELSVEIVSISNEPLSDSDVERLPDIMKDDILIASNKTTEAVLGSVSAIAKIEAFPKINLVSASPPPVQKTAHSNTSMNIAITLSILVFGVLFVYLVYLIIKHAIKNRGSYPYAQVAQEPETIQSTIINWKYDHL